MKRAIIIGATSGIGEEVAKLLIQQGWHIGIAGRRKEALEKLQATAPGQIEMQCLLLLAVSLRERFKRW